MASLFRRISKSKSQFRNFSSAKLSSSTTLNFLSARVDSNPLGPLFQVRSVVTAMEIVSGFDEMVSGSRRKYYMLGGKGGVGKTSSAASLAVKFANHGHPTIVVSTDPAHSLSDSFDQDLSGGMFVPVQGVNSSLYALEISPEKTKEQVQSLNQGELGVKSIMDNMGLGALAGQLGDFKIEELFDTTPGIDEVLAISKVMDILESEEYAGFSRIVFDTAPTGHTIRMLTLPKTMDASLGKMMKFKKKIASATAALKSAFGKGEPQLDGDRLDEIRETMKKVQDLFHDSERTEFVIITIPTVMALRESSRLCASLRKEKVPVNRLIVNQLLPPSTDCKFCSMKRKDQMRALDMIQKDPQLANLKLVHSPLMDVEIRGVPALKFMGDIIWK